jgi:hypothetical protein
MKVTFLQKKIDICYFFPKKMIFVFSHFLVTCQSVFSTIFPSFIFDIFVRETRKYERTNASKKLTIGKFNQHNGHLHENLGGTGRSFENFFFV